MPIGLNEVNQKWYGQKSVDVNGDGNVSREELFSYTNKAAQKAPADQTWDEALAGQLCKSADGQGGKSFFDIVSGLDGDNTGISQKDLGLFAAKDGKGDEIAGADIKKLAEDDKASASKTTPSPNSQTPDKAAQSNSKPPSWSDAHKSRSSGGISSDLKQNNSSYEVKQGDTMWDIAKNLSSQEGGYYSGKSTKDIMKDLSTANNISDPGKIKSGQKIKIKQSSTASTTQSPASQDASPQPAAKAVTKSKPVKLTQA